METANRSEAERCLKLAREAKRDGQADRAKRLAEKSVRLCPTQQATSEWSLGTVGVGGGGFALCCVGGGLTVKYVALAHIHLY